MSFDKLGTLELLRSGKTLSVEELEKWREHFRKEQGPTAQLWTRHGLRERPVSADGLGINMANL